jgi:integrase
MTETSSAAGLPRPAWNKGKITGPKPPLRPSHVWAIRAKLDLEKRTRDLAMFNLAIDSKLRGCDLVALRVDDVAPNGYAKDRANIRQRKTGRPVRFELTEPTREALDNYLRGTNRSRRTRPHHQIRSPRADPKDVLGATGIPQYRTRLAASARSSGLCHTLMR